jgi:sec-independent protein translocase protein TatB
MEILGIGPSEFVLIVVLALIILGPRDMQKAGRTLGRWLRGVVTSDGWKFFQQTSREIQTLPNRLMREAALEDLQQVEQSIRQPLRDAPESEAVKPAENASGAAPAEHDPESSIRSSPPPVSSRSDPDKHA